MLKIFHTLTNISFKNIFGPFIKSFLRIFFSDRKTATILKIIGSFFGLFRFLNFLLGFLIFINLYNFKNIYSIPASVASYLKLLRDNFYEALNKYYPSHPHLPKELNNSIHDISDKVSNTIDHTPVIKEVVHKIVEETNKADKIVETKFESLRKLYSNYVQSWFWNPTDEVSNSYSLFTDWKFYFGLVVVLGISYYFYGDTIKSKFSHSTPFDPAKRDDDYGRPGPSNAGPSNQAMTPDYNDLEGGHLDTPDSVFKRSLPGRFYDFITGKKLELLSLMLGTLLIK